SENTFLASRGAPPETQTHDHPESDFQGAQVTHIAALAHADSGMKGDRTLDEPFAAAQRRVEKMRVELHVYRRIQPRHQSHETVSPDQLIRRTDIGECTTSEIFHFQPLSYK